MRRIDRRRIRQREQLLVHRVVEHRPQLGRGPSERRAEIGSSDVADKQRVARQDGTAGSGSGSVGGPDPPMSVVHEQRNRFDRVPRCFQSLDSN